jgi:hypothetical protein
MARRRRTAAGLESLEDLARKSEILERELALQRDALEKLRQMSAPARKDAVDSDPAAARKFA